MFLKIVFCATVVILFAIMILSIVNIFKRRKFDLESIGAFLLSIFLICNWVYFFSTFGFGFGVLNLLLETAIFALIWGKTFKVAFGPSAVVCSVFCFMDNGNGILETTGLIPEVMRSGLAALTELTKFIVFVMDSNASDILKAMGLGLAEFTVSVMNSNGSDILKAMSLGLVLGCVLNIVIFLIGTLIALIGTWIYMLKYSEKRIEKHLSKYTEPLTESELCRALKVRSNINIENTFIDRVKKIAVTAVADGNTYIYYDKRKFDALTERISEFLLQNGNRDIGDICEVIGLNKTVFFIPKALNILIDEEIVKKISIGTNPDMENSPEGFAFAHVNKPMPTNATPPDYDGALDMDFD